MQNFEKSVKEISLIKKKINLINKINQTTAIDLLNQELLFGSRISISRVLFLDFLYKKIKILPGSIIEFGIHYGSTISILQSLRGFYEPYNHSRIIYGFDTFSGFPKSEIFKKKSNNFKLPKHYYKTLDNFLEIQEQFSPINHKKKFKLIKGDVRYTLKNFLNKNKFLLLSLVFFDLDLKKSTAYCLQKILKNMVKGGIIVFDQLNCPNFPGETEAVLKKLDIKKYKFSNFNGQTYSSYIQIN